MIPHVLLAFNAMFRPTRDTPQPEQRSGSTGKMLTYADKSSSMSPPSRVGDGKHWQDREHPQLPPVWLKFLDRLDAK